MPRPSKIRWGFPTGGQKEKGGVWKMNFCPPALLREARLWGVGSGSSLRKQGSKARKN